MLQGLDKDLSDDDDSSTAPQTTSQCQAPPSNMQRPDVEALPHDDVPECLGTDPIGDYFGDYEIDEEVDSGANEVDNWVCPFTR